MANLSTNLETPNLKALLANYLKFEARAQKERPLDLEALGDKASRLLGVMRSRLKQLTEI